MMNSTTNGTTEDRFAHLITAAERRQRVKDRRAKRMTDTASVRKFARLVEQSRAR